MQCIENGLQVLLLLYGNHAEDASGVRWYYHVVKTQTCYSCEGVCMYSGERHCPGDQPCPLHARIQCSWRLCAWSPRNPLRHASSTPPLNRVTPTLVPPA